MAGSFHANGRTLWKGAAPEKASGAVVLLHGRGAGAEDILGLADVLNLENIAYVAPEAVGNTWYPYSFLAPREQNEPYLSSALERIESVVKELEAAGIPREKIAIMGFSQGACLTTEFVASHPARYAGLIAFTGGLIGPLGSDVSHGGTVAGTPAFFGSSDPDPHVPWERVEESAKVLERMGAQVNLKRYPGLPHTISQDEILIARALLQESFGERA